MNTSSAHPSELDTGDSGGSPSDDPGITLPRVVNADDFEWPPGFQLALYTFRGTVMSAGFSISNHVVPASMQTPNGKPFDFTGFYSRLLNFDYLITRYDANGMIMGSSTSGSQVYQTSGGWISRMLPQTMMDYVDRGQAWINYLNLHEIAHTTDEATAATAEQFQRYLTYANTVQASGENPDPWEQTEMFKQSERFANGIAKSVANEVGLAFPPDAQLPGGGSGYGLITTWP